MSRYVYLVEYYTPAYRSGTMHLRASWHLWHEYWTSRAEAVNAVLPNCPEPRRIVCYARDRIVAGVGARRAK